MDQTFVEVENTSPKVHQNWLDKHGFKPDDEGKFAIESFEGKNAVEEPQLLENIRTNVATGDYIPLYTQPYDERIFVMVCGGPSLGDHLDEIRAKSMDPRYFVVCSNMTGGYLLKNNIVPAAHFILDPQEKKRFDVTPDRTRPEIQYWLNVACHPAVFEELRAQGIKPYVFLADFEAQGKAIAAVKESLPAGNQGMMAIQGGTMAGLRAINLADALGFRSLEYYGFDACVQVRDGKAKPYAYEKRRGEAIIEITCDRCDAKFDTTLIFQKQVNEFIAWRANMAWMDIKVIGGGLISHYHDHLKADDAVKAAKYSTLRYTPAYEAMQRELHAEGNYGQTGHQFIPTIFHAISQLAKKNGSVSVLDYGSAAGNTLEAVREQLWLPPTVTEVCYDPFVDGKSRDPEPADFVICTDVLEHVEPECTMAVLDHIAALTRKIAFFSIAMTPANKVLSDGRNAHINLRHPEFWLRELKKRFVLSEAKEMEDGLLVVAQSIEGVRETLRKSRVGV